MPEISLPALLKLLSDLWPGIVGALVAARVRMAGASFLDRAFTFGSSVLLSGVFGPALVAVFDIDRPYLQAAVYALTATFGLVVIEETVRAIREVGMAGFLKEGVRRIFGLGGSSGGGS